ncbi:nuclear transport factor 2 family protein [Saccharothrix xinjiangensis]|uniref:Nuclear transport factor 2 family protein n=1 Tax=Saccharothrix xinjiangensis TaxID=204798 RepID=A0ABV9Y4Q3_9PSEU
MTAIPPGSMDRSTPGALADRAAIHDVVAAFGLLFDSGGWIALGELFTEDARYELVPPPEGLPPVLETRGQVVAGMEHLWRHNREVLGLHQRHVTTNVLVTELGPEEATAHSVLTITGTHPDGRVELRRAGNYVDRFRRTGSRWRIAHRELHLVEPPVIGFGGEVG